MRETPPPFAGDVQLWAEDLTDYLMRLSGPIPYASDTNSITQDGIIRWDVAGYPVVSKNGEYRQIVLADGYGMFVNTSDVTFASAGTGYKLTYTPDGGNSGVSYSGGTITFDEAGKYMVSFSAQIYSGSSSTVNFVFWPKLNGANLGGSAMRNALHSNDSSLVVSRSIVMTVSAGDELEAYAAVDDTKGSLKAFASNSLTAGEPSTPSTTLSIIRMQQ